MKEASRSFVIGALILLLTGTASGQGSKPLGTREAAERKVEEVETKAGIVNFIEGDAACSCGGKVEALKPTRKLASGDVIRTGANSRAEVLLAPGYYLRLSENTQVSFPDLSVENLKVNVSKGSVILEVIYKRTPWKPDPLDILDYELIRLVTPDTEFAVSAGGVYRLDVGRTTAMKVYKGRAVTAGAMIKEGRVAAVQNREVSVTNIGNEAKDEFDRWSHDRAEVLLRANKALRRSPSFKQVKSLENIFKELGIEGPARAGNLSTINASSGTVNFVENGGIYRSAGAEGDTPLEAGVSLQSGDAVRNDKDSRSEIFLYSECYLYLSGGAEIIYLVGSDEMATVKLLKGSALIVTGSESDTTQVVVDTPRARYDVTKRGVYRFNVAADGRSDMLVYYGGAKVAGEEIKEGFKVVNQAGGRTLTQLTKGQHDSFDIWSMRRAAPLFVRNPFEMGLLSKLSTHRVLYKGVWFFDNSSGVYTFVPGLWTSNSPYGGTYLVTLEVEKIWYWRN